MYSVMEVPPKGMASSLVHVGVFSVTLTFFLVISLTFAPAISFASEDLLTIYKRAQDTDPALKAALADLEASKAERPLAMSKLLPQLTALAGIGRYRKNISGMGPDRIDKGFWGDTYSATLVQPIFNGQAYVSLKMAESQIQTQEAEVLAVSQDLMSRTCTAYFELLDARAQQSVARDNIMLAQKIYDQAESFLKTGTGDIVSVKEAKARLDAANARLIKAMDRVAVAEENLSILIHGQVGDILDVKPFNPSGPDPDDISDWVKAALDNQPRLKEAALQVRLANQEIDFNKRERWPTLNLEGIASYSKGAFMPDVIYRDVHGMVVLSVPFYLGGSIGAKTDRATAKALSAKHGLQRMTDEITFATKRAFLHLKDSVAHLNAARQAMESAKVSMDATNRGYEIGTRTVIDAVNMTDRYIVNRQVYLHSLYYHLLARIELKKVTGLLTIKDLESINSLLLMPGEKNEE
ncbi:MAG: channel protein TolC [Thermodesulfatator sp.]|nr:MAG: channel protein TolC [Thermodesulfatator sp.]